MAWKNATFLHLTYVHRPSSPRPSLCLLTSRTGMTHFVQLIAHVHPIMIPARDCAGCVGETFYSAPQLLVPADTSASGFYIPNAMNIFVGNAASGGWAAYAFPNTPSPLGNFQGTLLTTSNLNPIARPLLRFYANTAHSTGFYWQAQGPAIYVGAWLDYDPLVNNTMRYQSGRFARTTKFADGSTSIMVFEHVKVWMTSNYRTRVRSLPPSATTHA